MEPSLSLTAIFCKSALTNTVASIGLGAALLTGAADDNADFTLITHSKTGKPVKWGAPALATGATLTYGFARSGHPSSFQPGSYISLEALAAANGFEPGSFKDRGPGCLCGVVRGPIHQFRGSLRSGNSGRESWSFRHRRGTRQEAGWCTRQGFGPAAATAQTASRLSATANASCESSQAA